MTQNIYRLNDYDWWAGSSLEVVKAAYLEVTGLDEDDALDDPRELSDKEMDTLKHFGEDWENRDSPCTFREELARIVALGWTFPCPFACTEW